MSSSLRPPREARQERNPRYYALNDHPSYRAFGAPEWVDEEGRLYRAAPSTGHGNVQRLYVKLPHRDLAPPDPRQPHHRTLTLTSLDGHHRRRQVTLLDVYFMEPKHRTGHAHVRRSEWEGQ